MSEINTTVFLFRVFVHMAASHKKKKKQSVANRPKRSKPKVQGRYTNRRGQDCRRCIARVGRRQCLNTACTGGSFCYQHARRVPGVSKTAPQVSVARTTTTAPVTAGDTTDHYVTQYRFQPQPVASNTSYRVTESPQPQQPVIVPRQQARAEPPPVVQPQVAPPPPVVPPVVQPRQRAESAPGFRKTTSAKVPIQQPEPKKEGSYSAYYKKTKIPKRSDDEWKKAYRPVSHPDNLRLLEANRRPEAPLVVPRAPARWETFQLVQPQVVQPVIRSNVTRTPVPPRTVQFRVALVDEDEEPEPLVPQPVVPVREKKNIVSQLIEAVKQTAYKTMDSVKKTLPRRGGRVPSRPASIPNQSRPGIREWSLRRVRPEKPRNRPNARQLKVQQLHVEQLQAQQLQAQQPQPQVQQMQAPRTTSIVELQAAQLRYKPIGILGSFYRSMSYFPDATSHQAKSMTSSTNKEILEHALHDISMIPHSPDRQDFGDMFFLHLWDGKPAPIYWFHSVHTAIQMDSENPGSADDLLLCCRHIDNPIQLPDVFHDGTPGWIIVMYCCLVAYPLFRERDQGLSFFDPQAAWLSLRDDTEYYENTYRNFSITEQKLIYQKGLIYYRHLKIMHYPSRQKWVQTLQTTNTRTSVRGFFGLK
jgi:hypothetical protein